MLTIAHCAEHCGKKNAIYMIFERLYKDEVLKMSCSVVSKHK